MVDLDEAFTIADRIRRAGRRPSVRKVRAALIGAKQSGGSPRRIGEILDEWRNARGLSQSEADTGVPPTLQVRLDAVTATLWEAANVRAEAAWRKERLRLEADLDHTKRDLGDALAELAGVEERLRTTLAELEAQTRRADKAEVDQTRRAKEYWDRVLRAVGVLLKENKNSMHPSDILARLSDDLHREANYHAEALDLGTLTEKLKVRGKHNRYVEPVNDGSGMWRHRT